MFPLGRALIKFNVPTARFLEESGKHGGGLPVAVRSKGSLQQREFTLGVHDTAYKFLDAIFFLITDITVCRAVLY